MTQVLSDGDDVPAGITQQTVDALDGNDIVVINNTPGNVFNLYNVYGGQGGDFLGMGIDNAVAVFYGGGGSDTLHGGVQGDFLYGGLFDDLIVGGEFDYLAFENGGAIRSFGNEASGDDVLSGDEGADALYGLDGNDTLYGGNDDDRGAISVRNSLGGSTNVAAGLFGGAGDDYLDGGRGDDHLDGGDDADILLGGEDDDTLTGGAGADRMDGGFGNDRFFVDNAADRVAEAADGGADYVLASVSYGLRAGVEVERLSTTNTNGAAAISLTGNAFAQRIDGNQAGNKLSGQGGNDALNGHGGNDALYGGAGRDTLGGGLGNDSFVFDTALNAASNVDTIVDFRNAPGDNDTIRLENAVFARLTAAGKLDPAFFAANAAGTPTDANDFIVYNTTTGALSYDGNGNAAGGSVRFATLSGPPALTAADFLVM